MSHLKATVVANSFLAFLDLFSVFAIIGPEFKGVFVTKGIETLRRTEEAHRIVYRNRMTQVSGLLKLTGAALVSGARIYFL